MKRILSVLLILGGILIVMYPTVKNINSERKQKEIVQRWDEIMENLDEQAEIEHENKIINHYNEGNAMNNLLENKSSKNDEIEENIQPKIIIKDGEEGILLINKIDFKQPILKGSSQENLSITVSSVENAGEPGSSNYCIAGHRSKAYGRNFNRLDELENEDEIKIYTANNNYTYVVYEKFRVNPEDVWVLDEKEGQVELTLITCDPIINPNKRLIIKAKLKQ